MSYLLTTNIDIEVKEGKRKKIDEVVPCSSGSQPFFNNPLGFDKILT